ncbi:MAG: EAL domain-containing protein [Pseudomonadota bacterium]|nr:EAL domain-containing protein [Pseudomonadota bacterium]
MKPSLLFIEDDLLQSDIIMSYLEQEFETVHVTDCFKAQSELKKKKFDVVLTDYMLPKMNGLEFIQYLHSEHLRIPAVLLTASNNVRTAFEALRIGAYDFLSKDIGNCFLELLCPVLHRTLKQYKLNKHMSDAMRIVEEEKNTALEVCDSMSQGIVIVDSNGFVSYSNIYFKNHLAPLFEGGLEIGDSLETLLQLIMSKQIHELYDLFNDLGSFMNELQNPSRIVEIAVGCFFYDVSLKKLSNSSYAIIFKDITQQKMEANALNAILSYSPVPIVTTDGEGHVIFANKMAYDLTGYSYEDLAKNNINQLFHIEGLHFSNGMFDDVQEYGENTKYERQYVQTADQRSIPVDISISAVNIFGRKNIVFSFVDVTSTVASEKRMLEASKLTQSIIESSPFSIIATDTEGQILAVSPALEKLLWYSKDEIVGDHSISMFLDQYELEHALHASEDEGNPASTMDILIGKAHDNVVESSEWTCVRKDGSTVPISLTASVLKSHDNTITGYVFILLDITEQKKAHEYITHIAHHDELTGLPNRSLMRDRIQNNIARLKRYDEKFAVLLIDLDHFKRINDSLGHMAGDELLKEVSARMRNCLRESDTVCRIGGDEFVVILNNIDTTNDVEVIVKKIIHAVSEPVKIGQNTIMVTFSLGVSMAPDHSSDLDDLLRFADIAMYAAKNKGRNNFHFFSEALELESMQKMFVEQSLYSAYENKHLVMHYQPQIDMKTNQIVGFESLIRWVSPERGVIYPDQFLSSAETSGFIVTLGEWIMSQSIADVKRLSLQDGRQYKIAVNVSARQFDKANFVERVLAILQEHDFPPEYLQIEITESVILHKSEQSLTHFKKLKEHNVSIALDDFGTGYSSMSYITHYPIDTLKIDRSFMDLSRHENKTVISAVAAIAKSMNLNLVAEGIENIEQLAFVKLKGAQLAQGYYYSRPVDISDVKKIQY